jgi:tubulin polyglutamylase TTLL6/13
MYPHDYGFYPRTWVLPAQLNDLKEFFNIRRPDLAGRNRRDDPDESCSGGKQPKFIMIVKPDCMSKGDGIFLTQSLDKLQEDQTTYVVQEYMQDPYLIDGLKFDFRLYVLVLSADPLKIFLYKDGLVRFATKQYST